jgi:hypothetical protein
MWYSQKLRLVLHTILMTTYPYKEQNRLAQNLQALPYSLYYLLTRKLINKGIVVIFKVSYVHSYCSYYALL